MVRIEPLLATKFYSPHPREGLVQRPRLIEKLNAGKRGKVSMISAPAGYGKTTLLSSWVVQSDHPVTWLSLDENDNRLDVFLTYLVSAIQKIHPDIGADVLAALELPQPPEAEILLTLLINGIAERENHFTVVLDDCHLISSNEIFEALDYLIKYKPREFNLVLAGRVDTLISLPKLRVERQLAEIRSSDLQFSLEEAEYLLNQNMNLGLSADEIQLLVSSTEGWIAGLQLAALSIQKTTNRQEFIQSFSRIHHHVIDYLVDEVLSLQSNEIKSFLCRSSILERFNVSLCNAVLGITNSREIIHELEETNMFLVGMDDQRRWFRYHHLFGAFLKLCLEDDEAGSIPGLHTRAANWFLAHKYDSEAFSHYLLAEDMENATSFVENIAQQMLENSEFTNLKYWVDALPQENVDQNPRLGIYNSWALRLSGSPYELVENNIQSIEKVLEKMSSDPALWKPSKLYQDSNDELRNLKAHILAIRAFQGIYRQDPSGAIEMAEKAILLQPDEDFTNSGINFVLGWGYRLSGDLTSSHSAFSNSSKLSRQTGNTFMAVSTLSRAASGLVLMGKLNQAESDLLKALSYSISEGEAQNPVAGFGYVNLAGINLEWNNLPTAKDQALEGIQLSERVGQILDQVIGSNYLSRIFLAEGDIESAADICMSARELCMLMKDYLYVRRWAEDCQVRLWAAQDDYSGLEEWALNCGINPNAEPDFTRDVDHIILARAYVELSQLAPTSSYLDMARALLDKIELMLQNVNWNGKYLEVLLLQARALQLAGIDDLAVTKLDIALTLAEKEGYLRSFISEGDRIKELLTLNHFTGHKYAERIALSFDSAIKPASINPAKEMIEPLSPRELDVMYMLTTELSGPEIADEMNIALSTLRFHTRNIYEKFQVANRRSAVRIAREMNLV